MARAGQLMIWQLGYSAANPDVQDALGILYGPAAGGQNLPRFKLAAFYAIYERAARSLMEATGVPVLSGYDAFVGDPRAARDMPFSLTDTHPNCLAHEIFGEWVLQQWLDRAPPL